MAYFMRTSSITSSEQLRLIENGTQLESVQKLPVIAIHPRRSFDGPTIYIDTNSKFHRCEVVENLERYNSVKITADSDRRIKHFPDVFPEPDKIDNESR